ncbi:MAG TPA: HTH domain-containing protein [Candidatus Dormibacteraeota bacterium]|nr:HTH domain-containing protein [Candidatus Dormibacteraeota bacterium]
MTNATKYNYQTAAQAILSKLKTERDREIVAGRFGLGMPKRQTLEKIGGKYGITRERVRQIEKSAVAKLKAAQVDGITEADSILANHLKDLGHVSELDKIAERLDVDPSEHTYIVFLATLAPSVAVIEESDHFKPALALLPDYHPEAVRSIAQEVVKQLEKAGKPASLSSIRPTVSGNASEETLHNIASISKQLANMDGRWGLAHWPEVNPKSIKDKTYIALARHGSPLHFSEIADRIASLGERKRTVTVQAVHNELIKDPRFVLVGRGIYALRDWGYTPGTVADIITEILREETPLHKNEIVKRVLKKRQVKKTTIVLNLQEKDQFTRVAKATYALK